MMRKLCQFISESFSKIAGEYIWFKRKNANAKLSMPRTAFQNLIASKAWQRELLFSPITYPIQVYAAIVPNIPKTEIWLNEWERWYMQSKTLEFGMNQLNGNSLNLLFGFRSHIKVNTEWSLWLPIVSIQWHGILSNEVWCAEQSIFVIIIQTHSFLGTSKFFG